MEEKDNKEMKLYSVNVHYDAVLLCAVFASSDKEAIQKAEEEAATMSLEDAEVVGVTSCITDIEIINK